MYIRYETWNVRSLYRLDSLKTVASELEEYNLDLVAVKEVRCGCNKDGSEPADKYLYFYGNWNAS
jgi:hypothetical protein